MNLNKVFILGNLTRDPELRQTATGQNVATFSVATNRAWTDRSGVKQTQVEFHNVVLWGRLAEIAHQYLAKGRLVFIEGRMNTRAWQDQQTGQKRNRTEIVAETMQLGPRFAVPVPDIAPAFGTKLPAEPEPLPEVQLEEAPMEEEVKVENIPF
ncbi:MAG: single-stranded DNA-binding protein [Candidatus Azambacteria bacterium]|nr:single-stranded DNA-binding protein [Candidatus Azambacteria bacterium]